MIFKHKKNPTIYFADTSKYIADLARVSSLREHATTTGERNDYDNIIHVMQEVLLFMNTISKKDKDRFV